ncbi:PST family polysaccharide transporter [Sagittula marina]|uniref:PST family polysaccharide transporter n=1 Tax=Sagittula marina TaxID=943940 RepID=A0A7W6GU05_9RHOB|nr:oligosaccharide flippase family protein [Sagittula marina]MBB3985789.1 PST family polysaccharide transporter [Sagittula marina]
MSRTSHKGSFAHSLAAYCLSEMAAKASRLVVVVAVARTMDAAAIGVAAGALAAADILKALTENGVGQRIIAARDEDLAATCRRAQSIFWLWCLGLCAIQLIAGFAVWFMTGNALYFVLIAILAGEYLFMPAGLVQCALAMRAGKMRQTAAIAGGQVVGANVATAILAFIAPGPVALVLPRLLAAPIWLIAMRRLQSWRHDATVSAASLRPFVDYGWAVLAVELVKVMRLQADKIVIGLLMGPEALGLYFMAFNAGLGLSNSFSQALSVALFPHLCAASDPLPALRRALALSVTVIAPVVVLQALAAPVYVPILFGADWAHLAAVVSILCLAAIPGVIWSASAQFLRVRNRPQREFAVTAAITIALILNTALLAPHGLVAVAWGYLCIATVGQMLAALPILRIAYPSHTSAKVV